MFYRCKAENYKALKSRMLLSRQYFCVLVNENDRDAKFTQSFFFKTKLCVLDFIHDKSLTL